MTDSRTTPRTDRVCLDPDVPRCEPSKHCLLRSHCARYLAAVPAHGGRIADCTLALYWTPGACREYVPAADCTKPAPAAAPARKHWSDHG
jgi:hypothetical protein